MTDRDLLEWAAKAAGYWNNLYDCYEGPHAWDPLADDGDALRLAVKCGIAIYPPEAEGDDAATNTGFPESVWCSEAVNGDPYAATRRAIVRAAAEIGRGME